ncbi:methylated-DNA--[protein]-cysteine S-methyltransferase [Thiopseudomonas denitrificans]|uniref:methylated-DNA--[protein]-cysteine S-methyltransferase n=1 Tax=Thiopseudomonas denitrificans TaxID=1501432 RepID=A0A4R6TWX4_9GAMM|nr:methylated-DNA--[protein]-cysteine S-methyltransferase [Thiopseudomonas denitrificans]TDQ37262.1 AraC family transcriptional regulator of adaptative response/methylated-DNA-[protein]-cysteine methyltransferase [Thiopseudomonas denitrificans]
MSDSIHFAVQSHPFAALLAARDEQGVCAILLGDTTDELRADLKKRFPKQQLLEDENPETLATLKKIADFLDRPDHELKLKLHLRGTEFQMKVWDVLQHIPLGSTMSYSEVARRIGQPTAVRAVARAGASNPVALAVACHRVIRSDGGISGYRWGVERKLKLLEMERKYAKARP